MPCQHYKDALIEAAASSGEPQGDLRAHLDACAACRAVLEQEQSLFASIDAGLHVATNTEVPVSLLPRVRAGLDAESVPRRVWAANWLVLASAAGVLVALLTVRAVWHTNDVQEPVERAGNTSAPPRLAPSPQNPSPVVASSVEKNPSSQRQFAIAKNSPAHETLVRAKTTPEVLVPRDQEVLLADYAEQWGLRKRAPLRAQDADAPIFEPLQVAPIQIAELDVKPLAEEISQ
jgi:hypothetical protein